jgi:hypothetical protein
MMATHDKKSEGRYRISLEPTEVEVDDDGDVILEGYYTDPRDDAFLQTSRLSALGVRFERLTTPDEDPPGTVRVRGLTANSQQYYIKNAAGSWNLLQGGATGLSNTYNIFINDVTDTKVVEL